MSEKRLYGVPGAEVLYADPASVYESQIDGEPQDRTYEIEEWSVAPKLDRVPTADTIIEDFVERAGDDCCPDEYAYEDLEKAGKHPDVIAAVENARQVFASKINYEYADKHLRTLTVSWDDNGEPLLDGKPMYVKRAVV